MFRLAVVSCLFAVALALPRSLGGLPRLDGRIVNGEPTTIEDLPHQISLQYYGSHICGGSILDSRRVLTAAHCTDGQSAALLSIRAGSTMRGSGGQVVQVTHFNQHPDFTMSNLDSDVSVLHLAEDIEISDKARPISLTSSEPRDGEEVIVSGWGTLYSNGPLPTVLQKVKVNMLNREACQHEYNGQISPRMICAAAAQKDSCQGDSGGPLVTADKTTQVGVVSWGYGCADPDHAGVYSNVAVLGDYIKAN